jgi:hypothetical protein
LFYQHHVFSGVSRLPKRGDYILENGTQVFYAGSQPLDQVTGLGLQAIQLFQCDNFW